MKCVVHLFAALVVMWAASGHAQTIFPISENDVDASGTVLMCPKSNIYAPCQDTGSLPFPVKFGGAIFLRPHRETQEANADASGTGQTSVDALVTTLMCPSRGSTYAPCADAGTLPHSLKLGTPKLFAQVTTPYRLGYEQRHHRHVHSRVAAPHSRRAASRHAPNHHRQSAQQTP